MAHVQQLVRQIIWDDADCFKSGSVLTQQIFERFREVQVIRLRL
jgi:hypothetical protein